MKKIFCLLILLLLIACITIKTDKPTATETYPSEIDFYPINESTWYDVYVRGENYIFEIRDNITNPYAFSEIESIMGEAMAEVFIDTVDRGYKISCTLMNSTDFKNLENENEEQIQKMLIEGCEERISHYISMPENCTIDPYPDAECITRKARLEGSFKRCELLDNMKEEKDRCRYRVATASANIDVCNRFEDPGDKGRCIFSIAFISNFKQSNPDICFENKNEYQIEECLTLFKIEWTNDTLSEWKTNKQEEVKKNIEPCQDAKCRISLALKNSDEAYCQAMPDESSEQQAEKAKCFGILTLPGGDLSVCNNAGSDYYENVCRQIHDEYFIGEKFSERDSLLAEYGYEFKGRDINDVNGTISRIDFTNLDNAWIELKDTCREQPDCMIQGMLKITEIDPEKALKFANELKYRGYDCRVAMEIIKTGKIPLSKALTLAPQEFDRYDWCFTWTYEPFFENETISRENLQELVNFCQNASKENRTDFPGCINGPLRKTIQFKEFSAKNQDIISNICKNLVTIGDLSICADLPLINQTGQTTALDSKEYTVTEGKCITCKNQLEELTCPSLNINSRKETVCYNGKVIGIMLVSNQDIDEIVVQAHSGTAPEGQPYQPGKTYHITPKVAPLIVKDQDTLIVIPYQTERDGSISYINVYPFKKKGDQLQQCTMGKAIVTYTAFNVEYGCDVFEMIPRQEEVSASNPKFIKRDVAEIVTSYVNCLDCTFQDLKDEILASCQDNNTYVPYCIEIKAVPELLKYEKYEDAEALCVFLEEIEKPGYNAGCYLAIAPSIARKDFEKALALCQKSGDIDLLAGYECVAALAQYIADTQGLNKAFEFCNNTPRGQSDNCYVPLYYIAKDSGSELASQICGRLSQQNQNSEC